MIWTTNINHIFTLGLEGINYIKGDKGDRGLRVTMNLLWHQIYLYILAEITSLYTISMISCTLNDGSVLADSKNADISGPSNILYFYCLLLKKSLGIPYLKILDLFKTFCCGYHYENENSKSWVLHFVWRIAKIAQRLDL